jgi:uncharacterized protein DUF6958
MATPRRADDRVHLRNPDPTKKMPRIAKDLYSVVRKTALTVVPRKPPGITLAQYLDRMARSLPRRKGWNRSLSTGWHSMAIKLDLEARGELRRVDRKTPQRLIRG